MKVHIEQWQSGTRVIIEGLFGGELALSVAGAEALSQQLASAVQQARAADLTPGAEIVSLCVNCNQFHSGAVCPESSGG